MGDINSQGNKNLIYRLLNFQQSTFSRGKVRFLTKKNDPNTLFLPGLPNRIILMTNFEA